MLTCALSSAPPCDAVFYHNLRYRPIHTILTRHVNRLYSLWTGHLWLWCCAGLRVLIYSGDHDMCVPHTGSEAWTRGLALKPTQPWRPWKVNNQVSQYSLSLLICPHAVWPDAVGQHVDSVFSVSCWQMPSCCLGYTAHYPYQYTTFWCGNDLTYRLTVA